MGIHSILGADLITSKTNSTIVKIGKLYNKKYRNIDKLFLCDGIKLFKEACDFCGKISYIIVNDEMDFDLDVINKIKEKRNIGTVVICVTDEVFSKLSKENAPQGIITVLEYLDELHTFSTNVKNLESNEKVLVIESVRDPGNIGTIIRNAAAFGVNRLILSSDCADIYSSKVIRASMGAIFKVCIDVVSNLTEVIKTIKNQGKRVLCAGFEENSLKLGKDQISKNDVIVVGNEGHGVSKEILDICDQTIMIPMETNTESLNAAIAASIFMWELY